MVRAYQSLLDEQSLSRRKQRLYKLLAKDAILGRVLSFQQDFGKILVESFNKSNIFK